MQGLHKCCIYATLPCTTMDRVLYYIQDRKALGATVQLSFTSNSILMKPLAYYQTTSVSIPKKDDYMTIYYYKKGVMVGMKVGKLDEDFVPPKNCVEEKVLDEVSYNAHMKHYQDELLRLQNEFREDLISKYNMTEHSKANKLFDKAWDFGCSLGYEAVEDYFLDLTELFDKDDDYTGKERRKVDRRQSNKTELDRHYCIENK